VNTEVSILVGLQKEFEQVLDWPNWEASRWWNGQIFFVFVFSNGYPAE